MPSKVIIIVIEFMFLGINIFWALLRAHFSPRLIACGEQTHFSALASPAEKIGSAISSCKTISVTSVFLHQSEFGSFFCGANTRGLYVGISIEARKPKWLKMGTVHKATRLPKYAIFSILRRLTRTRKKQFDK